MATSAKKGTAKAKKARGVARGGRTAVRRGTAKPGSRTKKKAAAAKKGVAAAKSKARPGRPAVSSAPPVKPRVWVERTRPEALRLRGFAPGLTVADLDLSIDFYTNGLGFFISERWEKEGRLIGVMLKAGVCELGIGQDDWAKGRDRVKGAGVRLWCETAQDVDDLAERARAWGASLTEQPETKPWGVRAFSLDDPDGYHLTFYREIGG